MSDLEERCHIDKGTYTDGPVLTADVRRLFDRIAALKDAGTTMAGHLLFLADHLTGRIGEAALTGMEQSAKKWLELVPQEQET